MNYIKIYTDLITKRKSVPATGYTENHHILPKSLGGRDEPNNLVRLTGREHWIAHILLWKIHRCKSTAYAVQMMSMRCEERGIPRIKNSRMYVAARLACIKHLASAGKRRVGKANGSFGTMWITNGVENERIFKTATVPEGWRAGRRMKGPPSRRKERRIQIGLEKQALKQRLMSYYKIYNTSGFIGVQEAGYSRSQVNLVKLFKKYIPEFKPQRGKVRKTI